MSIVDSDAFLDMPLSTQALYFHLAMRADDDGFIGNPKKILRLICASEDDLKLLIAKRFILTFEDGVIVIKHWRMHNWMRNDRYTPTVYQDDLKQLGIKKNKAYTLDKSKCIPIDIPNDIPNGCQVTTSDIDIDLELDIDSDIDSDIDIDIDLDSDLDKDITLSKDNVRSTDVQRAVSEWNSLSDIGIKPISKLSSGTKRYQSLKARIKQYGIDEVIRAINRVRESDFLQGKKKSFTITFDWFVKPNNFPKVLDGNYDNDTMENKETGSAYIDAIKNRVSDVDNW